MRAGLRPDDTIIAIEGTEVSDWGEMAEIFAQNPGKELNIRVKRGEEILTLKVTPEPTKIKDKDGKEITIGRIGVSKKMDARIITSSRVLDIPIKALEAVLAWCFLTLEVVIKLIMGGISAKQIGGPILIVDAAAKAASVGLLPYFNLVAIISVNLAILNLMPVPVLDGGHLMFMGIEAIRRRPLSERVLMIANRIGMAILLMLITFVFYNDIVRVIIPWIQKIWR
jgi:regulator of sigma E protease